MKVYHDKIPTFGIFKGIKSFPEDYELVADVTTDSLDEAFRLTNHIEDFWFVNEEVTLIKKSRSTSIGDIIVDNNNQAYLVMLVGFEKIEKEV